MAAVDVFESEPILQGHPLLRLENAVCTPHIGYVEQDSYELYFQAAFENVVNFINQQPTSIRQSGRVEGDSLSDVRMRRPRQGRARPLS
jgi:phosphoglycerate dehydrogenase-like enzyme